MNIGLIFPNRDRKDKTVHLGLGYIAAFARQLYPDISFTVLDTRIATAKETRSFYESKFDLIGITVLSPVYNEVIEIFHHFKQKDNLTPICLGGPYVTTIMEEIFIETPADFAVYGEGEITFSELIGNLKGQKEVTDILGLMYLDKHGIVIKNKPRPQIKDLDTLPIPAYDLFKMDRYPMHRLVTSRGCPYSCSFCNSTTIWNNSWRKRRPEAILDEIKFLLSHYKKKTFCFSDNSFNIDQHRVEKFCELIINTGIHFLWSTPVRVEKITPSIALKMKKAGCYNVGIGVESANNRILEKMGKRVTIEEVTEGIKIFQDAGIEVLGQFVIGSPHETLESVKESIKYAKNSTLDFVMFYSILPFKGTPQWDYVKRNGNFYSEVIHQYHSFKPRILFDTTEFPYEDRLEAIRLAIEASYYCDSNEKNWFFDIGKDFAKKMQYYLPSAVSNKLYILLKNIYRKKIWNKRVIFSEIRLR